MDGSVSSALRRRRRVASEHDRKRKEKQKDREGESKEMGRETRTDRDGFESACLMHLSDDKRMMTNVDRPRKCGRGANL